ncbi:hypothetical protein WA026_001879 [Henosepilachna vigintioctopunctata]|uniref:Cytochrome P450 n=1 Tax=Henosepilachna vigintioctopunctata TaxID=420089 RepID=A0AAW1UR71_9CUCU
MRERLRSFPGPLKYFSGKIRRFWSKNIFVLKGKAWKNMRSTLSPAFTSSRMKSMFVLMCENAEAFVQYYKEQKEDLIEADIKDAFGRFTTDVIANIAYGIQVDSLTKRDNEFFIMGKEASVFGLRKKLIFFFYQCAPALSNFLRISIFGSKVKTFFTDLVRDTMKMREEQNIERPDIIGRMIKAKKGPQQETESTNIEEMNFAAVEEYFDSQKVTGRLTDSDIIANTFMFFIAGYDGMSSVMSFMAYELAVNADVQKKLIDEIDKNNTMNVAPSYETIVSMVYLDMVVSETLRKWPPGVFGDRITTKPYTIEPDDSEETPVHLTIKTKVIIPIYAIHHDPQYYENPQKFNPERFAPENRINIKPYTYLPFGVGPRNCIASRFALLELKAVFFYLLSNFEIVPIEKTQIPLKISKSSLNLGPERAIILGLKRRTYL